MNLQNYLSRKRCSLFASLAAGLAICLIVASNASAGIVVVPNDRANSEGGTVNNFPFFVTGGQRYQQVFGAAEFGSLTEPHYITKITFRPDSGFDGGAFSQTLSNVQINLSTTSAAVDGLNATFASNIGANDLQVYSGSLTLSSAFSPGPGGSRLFDIEIELQTPFIYDPTAGNLLLDVRNMSPEDNRLSDDVLDAQGTTLDQTSRVFGNIGAATGAPDTVGLITQFTTSPVPEPGTFVVAGLILTGLWRRRRSR